jgi:hypothetical protein
MDITMAALGTTVVAPSCAPTKLLFDAADDLSQLYMSKTWTASIKFRCLPVTKHMIGLPLDKNSIQVVNICDYLGSSLCLIRLYLDPYKFDKPPVDGEPLAKNPHWIQLKVELEATAHTSGLPIMCNGGKAYCRFKCKLCNRFCKSRFPKKDDAPRQDDCINMDKGGRRPKGRSQSKRTRTTQALTCEQLCPSDFTVKWGVLGFYITFARQGSGCPHHKNHLKVNLSKLFLPMQLIPEKEKEILLSMSNA